MLIAFLTTRAGKFVGLGLSVLLAVMVGLHFRNDARTQARLADARAQISAWKNANAASTAWAKAEKHARETADKARKEQADAKLELAADRGRDAADRYAAANRCVRAEASGRGGERADLSRPAAAPQEPGWGSAAADLVGVSRADFDACTVNTIRLGNAVEWAKGLGE